MALVLSDNRERKMSNRSIMKMLAIAGLLYLPLTSSLTYAATVLPAGSSWEYTFSDPTGSSTWNTTTGGWTTGNAPFGNNIGGGWDPNFDYATYWPADSSDGNDLWVRTDVDFTGYDISTAHWDLGVDNGFTLFVNGTLLASANAEGYTFRWEYGGGFGSLLNSGSNVIAVALEDHGGLTAFDMQITADTAPAVPLPAALPLMLSALGVLGFATRRRRNTTE
jgi:hypothetical protein